MIGASPEYAEFLASKASVAFASGVSPQPIEAPLFDYQRDAVEFCIRKGRAALFLDTGLGKTLCELEFCRQAIIATGKPALILTPLAVARQIEREGLRFGYRVRVIRDNSDVDDGINICNYERLDKLNVSAFGCVALDESSILKSFMGKTTNSLIDMFSHTPFRLCATATPAPNDHTEIGTHAEFLGVMPRSEMLMRWFINDSGDTKSWRLKGHAATSFWDWMASWSRMAETPADLGYDASRFVLPELRTIRHQAIGTTHAPAGSLFMGNLSSISVHQVKRQTTDARATVCASIIAEKPDEPWIVWVDTDHEQDAIAALVPDAIDIRGSLTAERKEDGISEFLSGDRRTLLTKGSICGFGMNFQHCANMVFVGRSFSYESWYQAVRRCWRFGQTRPVFVHIIVAEGEDQIGRVIDRKAASHAEMKAAMANAMRRDRASAALTKITYNPTHEGRMPTWLLNA